MKVETMARMANEITSFSRPYPEEEACAGIRDHIVAFWTPGMRSAFREHASAGGYGLDPLVAEAMRTWPAVESPIARATDLAEASGQEASDTGSG